MARARPGAARRERRAPHRGGALPGGLSRPGLHRIARDARAGVDALARDLRTELYEHLQRLSLSFYSRKKTGSLITRVTSDTDRLWDFLAFGLVDVSLAVIQLVGLALVLTHLDLQLGLVMALPVPFLCLWIWFHGRRMNTLFLRAWRKWSRVTDVVSDTIPGMKVVKAFHQEARERGRFDRRNRDATDEFNAIHTVWTLFWPALMLTVRVMIIGVWVLALPRVLGDGPNVAALTSGTFVAFLLYMVMFVQPIDVIGQMARIMNRATSSAHASARCSTPSRRSWTRRPRCGSSRSRAG